MVKKLNKGFTIIEAMVCVAIIAIIAVLTVPVLLKEHEIQTAEPTTMSSPIEEMSAYTYGAYFRCKDGSIWHIPRAGTKPVLLIQGTE